MRKPFWIVLSAAIAIVLISELNASAQNQPRKEKDDIEFVPLLAGASLGALLGALSTGFFEFSSAWARYCSGTLSTQELIKQRYRQSLVSMTLGPAIGATAGIIAVSQIYGFEGNTAMAFVGSFTGVGTGLGAGCYLLRVTKLAALEFVATVLPIGFAALGAINFYDARSRSGSGSSHQPAVTPSMSLVLWSLRF